VTFCIANRLHQIQIEQFIETIFPQQKPGHVKTTTGKLLSPEEVAKQKQDNKDNMWDMVYLMLAVFATLAVVTGIMVSRFTIFGLMYLLTLPSFSLPGLPARASTLPSLK